MARQASGVSVVIACHTEKRWPFLVAAIASVRSQSPPPDRIVISVDHNPELRRRLIDAYPDALVVDNEQEPGASGNRNSGAKATQSPIVAFLDDDARARPGWLAALTSPFADPHVVGTGGFVAPDWEGAEPPWFPMEFGWVVGASHLGLPTDRSEVRNVWSENMAVRRITFDAVGGFRRDFGKVGTVSRPEDTDLCVRMGKTTAGATWLFVPEAVVDHHVGVDRARFRYFLRRSFLEGQGKVELARINDGGSDLGDEQRYLRRTIPEGMVRYLRDAIDQRDIDPLRQAGAVAGGIGAAAVGAGWALLNRRR